MYTSSKQLRSLQKLLLKLRFIQTALNAGLYKATFNNTMKTNIKQSWSLQKLLPKLRCIQTAPNAGLSKTYLQNYDDFIQHPTQVSPKAIFNLMMYTKST